MRKRMIYTSSGDFVDQEAMQELPCIGLGACGRVYQLADERVIKILGNPGSMEQYKTMSKIKNLNLPNLYQIFDILSSRKSYFKNYAGNISSFHQSEAVDIWTMPSDWLIENYEGLFETSIKLGVPASNLNGRSANFVPSKLTCLIISPPPW